MSGKAHRSRSLQETPDPALQDGAKDLDSFLTFGWRFWINWALIHLEEGQEDRAKAYLDLAKRLARLDPVFRMELLALGMEDRLREALLEAGYQGEDLARAVVLWFAQTPKLEASSKGRIFLVWFTPRGGLERLEVPARPARLKRAVRAWWQAHGLEAVRAVPILAKRWRWP